MSKFVLHPVCVFIFVAVVINPTSAAAQEVYYLCKQSPFWWCNQIGIIFEIFGAGLMVYSAFTSRASIRHIQDTWDGELSTKLRDIIASQAITELKGFALLAVGLLLQFVGNFD